MTFKYNNEEYKINIERKISNKNTYIRVKNDFVILVTTSTFTKDKEILNLIKENKEKIYKMIDAQLVKHNNNQGFNYLGNNYDIIYTEGLNFTIGDKKVFIPKDFNIDKWYMIQAKKIFKERFDILHESFTPKVVYPDMKIRKMKSRWGVCNVTNKVITLNLELIKRDIKYLDYVIVHELAHLIHADHSQNFWNLVEENMSDYKKYRNEMKEF